MQADWLEFERRHVWHPYASMQKPLPAYAVSRAEGVYLEFCDGRRVIDGMSSWWCAIHGYNVPELNAAAHAQLEKMSHVMFGGLTHEPAANLAKMLLQLLPHQQHLFFCDSGSVAVEVAMKMALQYWQAKGVARKRRLLTLRGGYHGDTFGAMSVCDPVSGMHHLYQGVLATQYFADAPDGSDWHPSQIDAFESEIRMHHDAIAAVILEPLVQGAGGMRFYAKEYLQAVRQLCDRYDVLLIADEIATGFGRTGTMFACEQAEVAADITCVGKALTGGYMSLAATLCSAEVSDGIHAGGGGVLMHGPTFMANPLACRVAQASLELLLASPWQQRVAAIAAQLAQQLAPCRASTVVADVRVKGAIGVVEMKQPLDVAAVQAQLVSRGVWLRPFGRLLYTMPPFVISAAELTKVTAAMCDVVASIDG